jgi:GTPase SAR1 family protein
MHELPTFEDVETGAHEEVPKTHRAPRIQVLVPISGREARVVPFAWNNKNRQSVGLQDPTYLDQLIERIYDVLQSMIRDNAISPTVAHILKGCNDPNAQFPTLLLGNRIDFYTQSLTTHELRQQETAATPEIDDGLFRSDVLTKLEGVGLRSEESAGSLMLEIPRVVVCDCIRACIHRHLLWAD